MALSGSEEAEEEMKLTENDLVMTETNIMLLQYHNLKFIDSLNYIQMPLSAFPKTFGLGEVSKGYFPHLFNRVENQGYVDVMPWKDSFGIRAMSGRDVNMFNEWYAKKIEENYVFNFKRVGTILCGRCWNFTSSGDEV
uniref:Uncharacterized protein n=1 Tax=Bracon brevicornis TaxID=1563983 RepID=A0A6V7J5N6_9HYME